jgi:hypothetical protein
MVQPLNIRTIKSATKGAAQYVQDEKISLSRDNIYRFYAQGRWPQEYTSYVGRISQQTRYDDPNRFFRVMHGRPDLYAKDFYFQPIRDTSEQLAEATRLAHSIVDQKAAEYVRQPDSVVTGHYQSRFAFRLDGELIKSYDQFDNADSDSKVYIYNTAIYAGTIEKNALYYTKIGGVLFYAANLLRKAYPDLGISFTYWKAERVPGTYTNIYDVPMLVIGSKKVVTPEMRRPGRNHRSTGRRIRRRARGNQI